MIVSPFPFNLVVLELSLEQGSIRKDHYSLSILQAISKLTNVAVDKRTAVSLNLDCYPIHPAIRLFQHSLSNHQLSIFFLQFLDNVLKFLLHMVFLGYHLLCSLHFSLSVLGGVVNVHLVQKVAVPLIEGEVLRELLLPQVHHVGRLRRRVEGQLRY